MDRLAQDVERASNVIRDVLPVGETARFTTVVNDAERRLPGLSRDIIRGSIGHLMSQGEILSTGSGTIRRPSQSEQTTPIGGGMT